MKYEIHLEVKVQVRTSLDGDELALHVAEYLRDCLFEIEGETEIAEKNVVKVTDIFPV